MKAESVQKIVSATAIAGLIITSSAKANDYSPPKIYTVTPTGVNLSDGSYTFTETDLSIGPLSLERFYISGERDPNTKFFGPRITSNFDIYVARNLRPAISPGVQPRRWAPIVHIGATSAGVYTQDSLSAPTMGTSNRDAMTNTLDWVSGHYVFTAHDGTVYTFGGPAVAGNASAERVTSIAFTDGRTQTMSYDGGGRLKMVSDSSGYALIFEYNSSGLTSKACGFNLSQTYADTNSSCTGAALVVTYGYTNGLLTSVTGVDGLTTNYVRSGNEIGCIKPPGYINTCKVTTMFVNGVPWIVSQQTLAGGGVWSFFASGDASASRTDDAIMTEDPTANTTVTDPNQKSSYYRFSKSSPYSFVDANGHETKYIYTGDYESEWSTYGEGVPPQRPAGSLLLEADFPEGNKYVAKYDGPYNSISKETFVPKSGIGGAVVEYGYANCSSLTPSCTKPIWKKDPKGNQTDFAYTSFGAIQSEMQPAPAPGAARPLKLYTYVQKNAYVKNAGGSLVAIISSIWMPDTFTECQTAAGASPPATCDPAAAQRVTTYEYGADYTANNLLVRGMVVTATVDGIPTSYRSCYGYDARGRKITTTTPRGTTGPCS